MYSTQDLHLIKIHNSVQPWDLLYKISRGGILLEKFKLDIDSKRKNVTRN